MEVAFVGDSLNIFDLRARSYPAEVVVAPVGERELVGFDFRKKPPCRLTLQGRGKSRRLELRTRAGDKWSFRRLE